MLKISFDFDDTLSEQPMIELASKYISQGHEVYIVTARPNLEDYGIYMNKDIKETAKALGIPSDRVHYTDGAFKASILQYLEMDIHYDDMKDEIDKINNETECKGILV